jgi:NAD(P)-dependent dehydrogenase (short-subunit alcohol dehydrogenase family)
MSEDTHSDRRGYFVTGGTGFIGRHLIELLLQRPGRPIYVLVREASLDRFRERLSSWEASPTSIEAVVGDLEKPRCGLDEDTLESLRGRVGHFFHLGAVYDMAASSKALESANVSGTRHALAAAEAMNADVFHHVSSIAAAGRYPGVFRENMFEEAEGLDDPYLRTKHDAEACVRSGAEIPWRIYRPSMVVGHSQTGEIDKIDGPYYFFPTLHALGARLPGFLTLPGVEGGAMNLVPVDFVAAAIDCIAHLPDRDGETFHLVDPAARTLGATIDVFAEAAGSPTFSLHVKGIESLTAPVRRYLARNDTGLAGRAAARLLGCPPRALDFLDNPTEFDCSNAVDALDGSGIEVPPLESYASRLFSFWERNFSAQDSPGSRLRRAARGKRILVTGASAGIGRATAIKLAAAGADVILVARDPQRLEEVRKQAERVGGTVHAFSADLSVAEDVDKLVRQVIEEFGGIDVLVNNAGRSIRRSLKLSTDRFHDFQRTVDINYFGALRLILGFLPSMRRQRGGHIINVSSVGAQMGTPRFSAYVASKTALDGFSRCAAPELLGDGIDITTVYMPLVKAEMIAPTKAYQAFSTITPSQAADLICGAVISRPKRVSTPQGTMGELAGRVSPRVFDVGLHLAYRLFPDSAAARGDVSVDDEVPSSLGRVFAKLLPGIHW